MSDLGTVAFDTSEKVDILIKDAFNVSSTNENTPWYLETNAKYNTYINGEDILVDEIPKSIDWANCESLTEDEMLSLYNLTTSDFATGGGIKKDPSGVLHKFEKLVLQPVPKSGITVSGITAYYSYYHVKDISGVSVNLLENSFQKTFGDGTSFAYSFYTEEKVDNNVEIQPTSGGGNWFFNFKNGILFIPDPTKNSTFLNSVNSTKLPYFSYVKYVGKKGVANLTTSGGSVGSSSSTVTGENIIKLESITTINRMGNEDTLVYNLEDSGELSKLGSDLVSIGAKQEVLYNLDGTVSTSNKGYKWTSIHLYKDASGNYYLNGTNFSDTVENQIQHIKIDEILKKNYLLDDTKISSLFDSESLDVVGFATVTMNGTKRLGDLKKQWNAYNNDWLKITGNGLSYATMREGRHGCAYSFSSSNGMVIDTEFVDDDLRVMIGVYMENKNKNYSTIDTGALVQTLTNKTMDYNSNTFLNFPSGIEGSAELTQTLTNKTMDYNSNTSLNFPPGLQSSDNIGFSGNCTFSRPVYIGTTSSDGTLGIFYNGPYYALNVMNSHPTFPQAYFWNFTNGILIEANNSFGTNYALSVSGKTGVGLNVMNDNNVGIGTTSPNYPLYVSPGGGNPGSYAARYFDDTTPTTTGQDYMTSANISIGCNYDMWAAGFYASSDRRIKENIEDVPDDLALSQLKQIPVRYYQYKDRVEHGDGRTIGFIAQEVNEHLPMAVSIETKIIPNEMRTLEGFEWEEIEVDDEMKYRLVSDLDATKKYRYHLSDDLEEYETVECHDVFDKQWNHVFVYGEEVDDFHILDKQKLFALNFSATQELARKIEEKDKQIADLQSQVANLQQQVQTLFTLHQQ